MAAPVTQAPGTRGLLSSTRYIVVLLFLGNLLNYYDRALPAVVLELIKADFGLNDAEVGVLASAFVLVGALVGVPLGRLADRWARKSVAGWGLLVWSACTAAGGLLTNFWAFFATRIGVGVGEASYTPATGSLLSDLYPPHKRSRPVALFTLGFPIGTLLAFFTAGAIAQAFGTWRAPFLIAGIPGLVIAVLVLRVREPRRGAAEELPVDADDSAATVHPAGAARPGAAPAAPRASTWSVLRIRSMPGLILAYAGYNFAAYSVGTFITPVLQRYFDLPLVSAGIISGLMVGLTGLIALLVGGPLLDRVSGRSPIARHAVAATSLAVAALCSLVGFLASSSALPQFVLLVGAGYLFSIVYLAAYVPVTAEVVTPAQRSTAFGIIFAIGLLLGGAGGPLAVGALSDSLAASSALSGAAASAEGLKNAMSILVPLGYGIAAIGMVIAMRFARADRDAMIATTRKAAA